MAAVSRDQIRAYEAQAHMSSRFDIVDTPLEGLKLILRKPIGDSRGYLERLFCADELNSLMAGRESCKSTIR